MIIGLLYAYTVDGKKRVYSMQRNSPDKIKNDNVSHRYIGGHIKAVSLAKYQSMYSSSSHVHKRISLK